MNKRWYQRIIKQSNYSMHQKHPPAKIAVSKLIYINLFRRLAISNILAQIINCRYSNIYLLELKTNEKNNPSYSTKVAIT